MLLATQGEVTQMLLRDALSITTEPKDRLALAKFIHERTSQLVDQHRAVGSDQARDFLNGPTLQKARSKVASFEVRATDGGIQVDMYEDRDVIEGAFSEDEP